MFRPLPYFSPRLVSLSLDIYLPGAPVPELVVCRSCLHYGGLFIGRRAAEVLGDYGAGPNHVLPTGGTARYTGGLSVMTFLRVRTWMRIDDAQPSQPLVR